MLVIANRRSDIASALRIAKEFELRIVIWGGAEAWRSRSDLALAKVPVVLEPLTDVPRFNALNARLDNATLLRKAGVEVVAAQRDAAFSRDLRTAAGNEVRNGMSWDDALRSVTLAAGHGVRHRIGAPGRSSPAKPRTSWSGRATRSSSPAGPSTFSSGAAKCRSPGRPSCGIGIGSCRRHGRSHGEIAVGQSRALRRMDHAFPGITVTILVMLATLAACGGRGGAEGPWEFKVDSSAGAHPAASLRSVGQEGPRGEPQKTSVVLSLDCRADHTGATILTQQSLRQGSVEAELSLDGGPARRIPGFAGTTGTSGQLVLTVSLDSVLALLAGHQRATVDYEDGAGSSKTTAVFPVAGLEARRAEFVAACDRSGGDRKRPPR